jgi:hypothetical protein
MAANWTLLKRFGTFLNVAAVSALPFYRSVFLEDLPFGGIRSKKRSKKRKNKLLKRLQLWLSVPDLPS